MTLLLLLTLHTFASSPQPPVSLELAARASQLLASSSPLDRAWGCRLAAGLHQPALQFAVLDRLRSSRPHIEAAQDSPEYAVIQCLLDALIEQGGEVPVPDILPFHHRWPAETIILLARSNPGADSLDSLIHPDLPDTRWFALNNLLLARHPLHLRQRILAEFFPSHRIVITRPPLLRGGAPTGHGDGIPPTPPARRFSSGFPPISLYRLRLDPCDGCSILIEGPVTVYFQRVLVPSNESVVWPASTHGSTGGLEPSPARTSYRIACLARLLERTETQLRAAFLAQTTILYRSDAQVRREVGQALLAQTALLRQIPSRLPICIEILDLRRVR